MQQQFLPPSFARYKALSLRTRRSSPFSSDRNVASPALMVIDPSICESFNSSISITHPFRNLGGFLYSGFRQQNDKLLTSEAT